MNLLRGDIFVSRNPMMLGRGITAVTRFWSSDDSSEYSHAGIIVDSTGSTFESLHRIRHSHLVSYVGQKVLIGRLLGPTQSSIDSALLTVIAAHKGQLYPYHRLIFHLFPPLAKYISVGKYCLCSELTMKMVLLAGIGSVGRWQGKNPDHVADFIRNDDSCKVEFEGTLEKDMLPILPGGAQWI